VDHNRDEGHLKGGGRGSRFWGKSRRKGLFSVLLSLLGKRGEENPRGERERHLKKDRIKAQIRWASLQRRYPAKGTVC